MFVIEESEVLVVIAIFNGPKESELLGVFGDFADVFVLEKSFTHSREFAALRSMPGFGVVLGVREVELGATFAAEKAVVDVFEKLLDSFFVGGAFFVTIRTSVQGLDSKRS